MRSGGGRLGVELLGLRRSAPLPPATTSAPLPPPPSPDRSRQKVAGLPLGSGRRGNAPLFFSLRRPRLSPERWLRMQMAFITAPRSIEKSLTQTERCGEGGRVAETRSCLVHRSLAASVWFIPGCVVPPLPVLFSSRYSAADSLGGSL